jgi:hypothetical protein
MRAGSSSEGSRTFNPGVVGSNPTRPSRAAAHPFPAAHLTDPHLAPKVALRNQRLFLGPAAASTVAARVPAWAARQAADKPEAAP